MIQLYLNQGAGLGVVKKANWNIDFEILKYQSRDWHEWMEDA